MIWTERPTQHYVTKLVLIAKIKFKDRAQDFLEEKRAVHLSRSILGLPPLVGDPPPLKKELVLSSVMEDKFFNQGNSSL